MSATPRYEQSPTYRAKGLRGRLGSAFSGRSRDRRLRTFVEMVRPQPGERILDVGCGPGAFLGSLGADIELIGLDRAPGPVPDLEGPGRSYVQGDALELPFADDEFDIAFSNSVVEHIDPAGWDRFASEIQRVARRYFVQTPNRHFPIEPHALLPMVQYLPPSARSVAWRLSISGGPYEEITLLTEADLRDLFPDARIVRERFGPLTKSLLAVGPVEAGESEPR